MNFLNIPILLTFLRVVLVPCFAVIFYMPTCWSSMLCTFIFFIAAITDWFDGFLARRWQQTTKFGKFLDPVADKIMIITALILVSEYFHTWWVTVPTFSIIVREIVISALREWVASINYRNNISVVWISKIKTCIQMLALITLLWRSDDEWIVLLGILILYVSVLLTLCSMCYYMYIVRNVLINHCNYSANFLK